MKLGSSTVKQLKFESIALLMCTTYSYRGSGEEIESACVI